jgi:hypothetical protein
MARRNRNTLKHFFREGALPSADEFGDLIDSTVNQIDEGFDRTPQDGLKIASQDVYDSLLSFYRGSVSGDALWSITYDDKQDSLLFKRVGADAKQTTVLALSPDGRIGVNRKDPAFALDVGGAVRSEGRLGASDAERVALANGNWHDITGELSGCQALEVMAGVGKEKSGRYALMHATALNTFNPAGLFGNFLYRKKRIRCQHAYYSARGNRLQLRWFGSGRSYRLQLRTRCDYGEAIRIQYHITRLWFDEAMRGSWSQQVAGEPSDGEAS